VSAPVGQPDSKRYIETNDHQRTAESVPGGGGGGVCLWFDDDRFVPYAKQSSTSACELFQDHAIAACK